MAKQIIYRKQTEKGCTVVPDTYRDEKELQKIIAINSQLVVRNPKSEIIFSKQEVQIKGAGFADVILLDSEGFPIIVEVKLGGNPKRREVIAQVFDYVSSIRDFTFPQLNEATKGKLEKAIKKYAKENKSSDLIDKIKKNCAENLKDEQIKMVIAMDSVSPDLIRIVDFVNDHSNIDLCLVEINKYSIDNNVIFVPSFIVDGGFNINDGTKKLSIKLQQREIVRHVKNIFKQYDEWLNELKSNINKDIINKVIIDDLADGWYYTFKIYQSRGDSLTELYVRMLKSDNTRLFVGFGFSQDSVNGKNEYYVECRNVKTQTSDKKNNQIINAFVKNDYELKDERKGSYRKKESVKVIGFESFEKFAKKEMEIIKPIIEKIVINS